jgi:hypothetical protein
MAPGDYSYMTRSEVSAADSASVAIFLELKNLISDCKAGGRIMAVGRHDIRSSLSSMSFSRHSPEQSFQCVFSTALAAPFPTVHPVLLN